MLELAADRTQWNNWLLVSFLSHVNKNIIHSSFIQLTALCASGSKSNRSIEGQPVTQLTEIFSICKPYCIRSFSQLKPPLQSTWAERKMERSGERGGGVTKGGVSGERKFPSLLLRSHAPLLCWCPAFLSVTNQCRDDLSSYCHQ